MLMATAIHLEHASVSFGATKALQNVTLDIPSGKIVGFLGPSGAGKTTLMRVIVGRQPLQKGKAEVLGQRAGAPSLRDRIGYMPQSAGTYQDLTVQENLRYFAVMRGLDRKAADRAIAEVDLMPQSKQLVSTLSGGQRSRLSLAVALLGEPELLVLDEPTVGVDPALRLRLWHIFRRIAERGTTIYISSHVMDEASRCDELLLIRRGRVLAYGTPAELLQQTHATDIESAFLALAGAPRT